MKKFLALALAVLMVLTLATFAVGAEETNENKIVVSTGEDLAADQNDGNQPGWRNSKVDAGKAPLEIMEIEGQKAVGFKLTGSDTDYHKTIRFLYYTDTAIDISNMHYLEFDFYISDASHYNGSVNLELTSSGRQDYNEISCSTMKLQNGWNHIKIDLARDMSPSSTGTDFDATHWNFMRFHFSGGYNITGELILAIDNLAFTRDDSYVPPVQPGGWIDDHHISMNDCDAASGLTHATVKIQPMELEGADGETVTAWGATMSGTVGSAAWRTMYKASKTIDISTMKYIEFDLYVSNAAVFKNQACMLELTSSGGPDVNEISHNGKLSEDLVDGWNHIRINIHNMTNSSKVDSATGERTEIDKTAFNYMRLFNNNEFDAGESLTLAIDNVIFWDGLNEDGLDEEQVKQQEMLAQIQPVLDLIEPLKDIKSKDDITAENYEDIKAKAAAAREAYADLNDEQKDAVKDYDGLRTIMTAESAIEKYEKELPPENDGTDQGGDTGNSDTTGDTATGDDNAQMSGCASAITLGAGAMMLLAAAWVSMTARKKED